MLEPGDQRLLKLDWIHLTLWDDHEHMVNSRVLRFKYEVSPMGSRVWTPGLLLVGLLRRVWKLEEMGSHWRKQICFQCTVFQPAEMYSSCLMVPWAQMSWSCFQAFPSIVDGLTPVQTMGQSKSFFPQVASCEVSHSSEKRNGCDMTLPSLPPQVARRRWSEKEPSSKPLAENSGLSSHSIKHYLRWDSSYSFSDHLFSFPYQWV